MVFRICFLQVCKSGPLSLAQRVPARKGTGRELGRSSRPPRYGEARKWPADLIPRRRNFLVNAKRVPLRSACRQLTLRSLRSGSGHFRKPRDRKPHSRLPVRQRRDAPIPWLAPGGNSYEAAGRPRFGGTTTRWCGIDERFPGWPCRSCSDLPFLSRARICGTTIFD